MSNQAPTRDEILYELRRANVFGKTIVNPVLVSTECPTCGAPLDFLEGSNAVQCAHCKSNLLVTGRKQLLSYFIRPKLDVHRAVAKAMVAHKESGHPCRMISPQLFFIPYYRLIGHDFRWELKPKEKKIPEAVSTMESNWPQDTGASVFEGVSRWVVNRIFDQTSGLSSPLRPLGGREMPFEITSPHEEDEVHFQDQYVEKNFIGLQGKEIGLYSLGVRPAVLKLELFGKNSVETIGKLLTPDLSPEEAFQRGMKTAGGENLLYRQVLGRILSLIYFPFWIMEVEIQGEPFYTILDAVAESVIQLKLPQSFKDVFSRPLTTLPQGLQFRPLVCPNCGWDFQVRKEDVIFFCDSCKKAWQIIGHEFSEVSYQIVETQREGSKENIRYLPFWIIDAEAGKTGLSRYLLPGFRYRRLKTLADIALALSRKNPSLNRSADEEIDASGCFYDQEDAYSLARVTLAGTMIKELKGKLPDQPIQVNSAKSTLTWIPFRKEGDLLFDPFTGMSVSQSLMI